MYGVSNLIHQSAEHAEVLRLREATGRRFAHLRDRLEAMPESVFYAPTRSPARATAPVGAGASPLSPRNPPEYKRQIQVGASPRQDVPAAPIGGRDEEAAASPHYEEGIGGSPRSVRDAKGTAAPAFGEKCESRASEAGDRLPIKKDTGLDEDFIPVLKSARLSGIEMAFRPFGPPLSPESKLTMQRAMAACIGYLTLAEVVGGVEMVRAEYPGAGPGVLWANFERFATQAAEDKQRMLAFVKKRIIVFDLTWCLSVEAIREKIAQVEEQHARKGTKPREAVIVGALQRAAWNAIQALCKAEGFRGALLRNRRKARRVA
jgi:hypothetical protein